MAGQRNNRANGPSRKRERDDEQGGSTPGPRPIDRPDEETTEHGHTPGERPLPERQDDVTPDRQKDDMEP